MEINLTTKVHTTNKAKDRLQSLCLPLGNLSRLNSLNCMRYLPSKINIEPRSVELSHEIVSIT